MNVCDFHGHAFFNVGGEPYSKYAAGQVVDHEVEYVMLACFKCGKTMEILARDLRKQ